MEIVIVGGSLSGLLYGIILKDLGHNVRIFERNKEGLIAQAGAGIQVPPDLEKFMAEYRCDLEPYYLVNPKALVVDQHGNLVKTLNPGVRATSWDSIYYRLRARFDGLRTKYYDQQLEDQAGTGNYCHGYEVDTLSLEADKIKVEYRDQNGPNRCEADMVVVADGSGSKLRQALYIHASPEYLGYVAIRGTVPPDQATITMRNGLDRHCQISRSFFLSYTMPGEYGKIDPTERVRNWVWYRRLEADSEEFQDLMTDVRGKTHKFSLPRGGMRGDVWEKLQSLGQQLLDQHCADHLQKSVTPFVQAVTHLSCSKALYHGRKVLLVGDAFATLRPLSGQGTNQAAKGALALRRVFQNEITLEEWEASVIQNAEAAHKFGLAREKGTQLSD